MTAPDRLPPALQKEQSLQHGSNDRPFVFNLPPNTAGMAKRRSGPQIPKIILPPPPPPPAPAPTSLAEPVLSSRPLPVILPASAAFQPIMFIVAPQGQTVTLPAALPTPQPSVP